jgi:hypothetical protein
VTFKWLIKKFLASLLVHRSGKKDWNPAALEARQAPDGSPSFNDSFYFCGRDAVGTSLVFRLGFRPARETELWCDLVLPGIGRLRAPSSRAPDPDHLGSAGLRFECKEPARTWRISYSGEMQNPAGAATVDLLLDFHADGPMVDFTAHGDSRSLAGYLAGQKWSRAWLSRLRDLRQVHYEQGGTLKGRIAVDGREREISLPAVRDHSFGARDWKAMRRHVWLLALLEDGSQLNLSLVSYDFLPYMHSGYRIEKGVIEAVTQAPHFEEVPEDNRQGSSFDWRFRVGKSEWLTLRCQVEDVLEYTMNDEYRFHEGLASFSLGPRKGVGVCEFGHHTPR